MPGGRPSSFTQEIADRICERLASGESLRAICLDAEMPSRETVRQWLDKRSEFLAQYTRARDMQHDYWADEILGIADANNREVDDRRLQIDARKWLLSKLAPKKYGDRVAHDVSVRVAANEMSDDDLAKIASDRAALIEALPEDYPGRPPD